MTAQIPDQVEYREQVWDLVGADGDGLFTPEDHGMKAAPLHSACWRGFEVKYRIEDEKLLLDQVQLNPEDGICKTIGGREPEGEVPFVWKEIGLPVSYNGKLILGRDFIQEEYIHMGFQAPSCYRHVLELIVVNGEVTEVSDRSAEYSSRRGNLQKAYLADPFGNIDRAFSLDPEKDEPIP